MTTPVPDSYWDCFCTPSFYVLGCPIHDDTTPPPPVCPECRDGKHGNCIGYALGPDDVVVACGCAHSER
jgi:hypothetical protein